MESLDQTQPRSEETDASEVRPEEIRVALKFCGVLGLALLVAPWGGLLWQPGAAPRLSRWCLDLLLAFAC